MIQEKLVDFSTLPNPQPGTKFIGFDLDGKYKSKDSSGVIAEIGTTNSENLITQISAQDLLDIETLTGNEFLPTTAGKISIVILKTLFKESFFLDGLMFIGESTVLNSTHENKFLVCGNDIDEEILITLPNENIFSLYGGKLNLYFITKGGYNLQFGNPIFYPAPKQTAPNNPNSLSQLLKFTVYNDDESNVSCMTLDSITDSVVVDENGVSMHAINYLLQKATLEKIITLGTITFEDVNSASAISLIEFDLLNIPVNHYLERIFIDITEVFDLPSVGSSVFSIDNISFVENLYLTIVGKSLANVTPNTVHLEGINDAKLILDFDTGSSEVNPRNLTTGSITIKALIRKFPN